MIIGDEDGMAPTVTIIQGPEECPHPPHTVADPAPGEAIGYGYRGGDPLGCSRPWWGSTDLDL